MGIKDLTAVIKEQAKNSISIKSVKQYKNKRVAIDASMFLYQFLVAIRAQSENLKFIDEDTSHLVGFFYRTIHYIENQIEPIYVFDGLSPILKTNEINKRRTVKENNKKLAEENKDDKVLYEKFSRRSVHVTQKHTEECIELLSLMGIPFIISKSEAEAQCAYLAKKGIVDFVASNDTDSLPLGVPVLLKNFTSGKKEVEEINLKIVLKELELTYLEFVDFCILLGCDYCERIKKIGKKKALQLIKKHKNLETIFEMENIKIDNYQEVRECFLNPEIEKDFSIEFGEIKKDQLMDFLIKKGFNKERIESSLNKVSSEAIKKKNRQTTLF